MYQPRLFIAVVLQTLFLNYVAKALPSPMDLTGRYVFANQIELLSVKTYETVWANDNSGKERLNILRANGYACMHKYSGTYNCSKFLKKQLPAELVSQVENEYSSKSLEFFSTGNGWNLINEAESLVEFEKIQESNFADIKYDRVRFVYGDGFQKIVLEQKNMPADTFQWLNFVDNQIYVPKLLTKVESAKSHTVYFVNIKMGKM